MKCIHCNRNVRTTPDERAGLRACGLYTPGWWVRDNGVDPENMTAAGLDPEDFEHFLCWDCGYDIETRKQENRMKFGYHEGKSVSTNGRTKTGFVGDEKGSVLKSRTTTKKPSGEYTFTPAEKDAPKVYDLKDFEPVTELSTKAEEKILKFFDKSHKGQATLTDESGIRLVLPKGVKLSVELNKEFLEFTGYLILEKDGSAADGYSISRVGMSQKQAILDDMESEIAEKGMTRKEKQEEGFASIARKARNKKSFSTTPCSLMSGDKAGGIEDMDPADIDFEDEYYFFRGPNHRDAWDKMTKKIANAADEIDAMYDDARQSFEDEAAEIKRNAEIVTKGLLRSGEQARLRHNKPLDRRR